MWRYNKTSYVLMMNLYIKRPSQPYSNCNDKPTKEETKPEAGKFNSARFSIIHLLLPLTTYKVPDGFEILSATQIFNHFQIVAGSITEC